MSSCLQEEDTAEFRHWGEIGWCVLLGQDVCEGTATAQFHRRCTPTSIMNTTRGQRRWKCWWESIRHRNLHLRKRWQATCAVKQEDSLSPSVHPPPHTPLHSTHVYCVYKLTKGSSFRRGRCQTPDSIIRKMAGFISLAAPQNPASVIPAWWLPSH